MVRKRNIKISETPEAGKNMLKNWSVCTSSKQAVEGTKQSIVVLRVEHEQVTV
jgi:hypothetical protein